MMKAATFFYVCGFVTGFLLALVLKQNEIKYPNENLMQEICAGANSDIEHYTEEIIKCKNGARFHIPEQAKAGE